MHGRTVHSEKQDSGSSGEVTLRTPNRAGKSDVSMTRNI